MKKITFLFLMMVLTIGLKAESVSVETAKQLGGGFLSAKTKAQVELHLIYTEKTSDGTDAFYVFNCQPCGFVIVSADNRMQPVLAYSTTGKFSLVAEDAGWEVFFDIYRSDLETAIAENLSQSSEVASQWQMLADNGTFTEKHDRTVGPLCTSTWHQTQLYNDQCPADADGYNGHVKVGCVANAMAQLMRYWEWPKTGTGSHTYYCWGYGSTTYGDLTADFGAADYRYELMPGFLDYTSPQNEVDAIALLEYHAGVSVEMDYGPNASGAYSGDVPAALQNYFRYSSAMSYEDRDDYTDAQWISLLKEEFDANRPVYYSAYSYTKDGNRGGHAFVCDGYDENDFMHFNWGWQGFDNGFYSINAMNLTHHQYNYSHYCIINMVPGAGYTDQPMPVDDLNIEPMASGMAVTISLTAPSATIGGSPLTDIDSIVVLMNGEPLHTFFTPQPGESLNFETFLGNEDCGAVNYFTIYPVTSGGRGRAITEKVPMWSTGSESSPMTFHLHDSAGDGWLSPAISILDERGVVQHRIGLESGYEATVTVNVPVMRDLILYWNYCNIGYEDDDAECTFEVYDYKGDLLYERTTKPRVGEMFTFYSEYDNVVLPAQVDVKDFVAVRVFNILGRPVYVGKVENFDFNTLEKGVYLMQYTTSDGKIQTYKISK